MTATAAPTVKDQELVSIGLVESASVNSITDFIPSNSIDSEVTTGKEMEDFANTFICHMIFYIFYCVALVLYLVIDLGFGSFIKKKYDQVTRLANRSGFEKKPVFA